MKRLSRILNFFGRMSMRSGGIIRIADSPSLLEEEYEQRYQKYYEMLDAYLHDGITQGIAEAFRNIVSPDALEMYRKVCPEFVERFFA